MSTFFQQTAQANTHECNHLLPLLEGIAEGTIVYADKGYDSKENRQHLKEHRLLDGIMRKVHRNRPLVAGRHYAQSPPQPSAGCWTALCAKSTATVR